MFVACRRACASGGTCSGSGSESDTPCLPGPQGGTRLSPCSPLTPFAVRIVRTHPSPPKTAPKIREIAVLALRPVLRRLIPTKKCSRFQQFFAGKNRCSQQNWQECSQHPSISASTVRNMRGTIAERCSERSPSAAAQDRMARYVLIEPVLMTDRKCSDVMFCRMPIRALAGGWAAAIV